MIGLLKPTFSEIRSLALKLSGKTTHFNFQFTSSMQLCKCYDIEMYETTLGLYVLNSPDRKSGKENLSHESVRVGKFTAGVYDSVKSLLNRMSHRPRWFVPQSLQVVCYTATSAFVKHCLFCVWHFNLFNFCYCWTNCYCMVITCIATFNLRHVTVSIIPQQKTFWCDRIQKPRSYQFV